MKVYYIAGMLYSDELYHHGIKGQKWGKRNGPPYPLNPEDHSVKEKKLNYRKSLNKNESGLGNWSDRHHLTRQQKAMIAAGVIAAAAIGAAVVYDYKTGNISSSVMTSRIQRGQNSVKLQLRLMGVSDDDLTNLVENDSDAQIAISEVKDTMDNVTQAAGIDFQEAIRDGEQIGGSLARAIAERDSVSDLGPMTKLSHAATILEDARSVNPNFSFGNPKTSTNCGLCSMAYDMRRRGYDAFAGLSDSGTTRKDMFDLYPGVKMTNRFGNYDASAGLSQPSLKASDVLKVIDSFKSEPGSRGTIFVSWAYTGGGHAMSYEVSSSGVLSIIDPQCGNVYSGSILTRFLQTTASIDSFRLDNVEPDIEQMMRRNLIL